MNRIEKQKQVTDIKDYLSNNTFIALAYYRGMNDSKLYNFRVLLKKNGCNIKVLKNTLINVAIKDTKYSELSPYLKGPVAFMYSNDPVALSKVINDTSKEVEQLKPLVGFFNDKIVTAEEIVKLAKLGSINDVRASFVYTLRATHSSILSIFKNYISKNDAS